MNFEPIQFSDLPVITALSPEGWGNVPIKIQHYIESPFCFPIKLLVDQKIVAIGTTIIHSNVAWLGHIIVAPDERGKGYGKQTTQELIRIANNKKCNSIQLIATDMGAPVYSKLGFKESSSYLFFDDIQAPHLEEADNNIQQYQSRYKEQLLRLDLTTAAENRRCEIEPHFISGFLYVKNKKVLGYYLPSLGEGLIVANEQAAGMALLKMYLMQNSKVVLPKENTTAVSFLLNQGCPIKRQAKRMYLGENIDVQFQSIFNRIGGNLG